MAELSMNVMLLTDIDGTLKCSTLSGSRPSILNNINTPSMLSHVSNANIYPVDYTPLMSTIQKYICEMSGLISFQALYVSCVWQCLVVVTIKEIYNKS